MQFNLDRVECAQRNLVNQNGVSQYETKWLVKYTLQLAFENSSAVLAAAAAGHTAIMPADALVPPKDVASPAPVSPPVPAFVQGMGFGSPQKQ